MFTCFRTKKNGSRPNSPGSNSSWSSSGSTSKHRSRSRSPYLKKRSKAKKIHSHHRSRHTEQDKHRSHRRRSPSYDKTEDKLKKARKHRDQDKSLHRKRPQIDGELLSNSPSGDDPSTHKHKKSSKRRHKDKLRRADVTSPSTEIMDVDKVASEAQEPKESVSVNGSEISSSPKTVSGSLDGEKVQDSVANIEGEQNADISKEEQNEDTTLGEDVEDDDGLLLDVHIDEDIDCLDQEMCRVSDNVGGVSPETDSSTDNQPAGGMLLMSSFPVLYCIVVFLMMDTHTHTHIHTRTAKEEGEISDSSDSQPVAPPLNTQTVIHTLQPHSPHSPSKEEDLRAEIVRAKIKRELEEKVREKEIKLELLQPVLTPSPPPFLLEPRRHKAKKRRVEPLSSDDSSSDSDSDSDDSEMERLLLEKKLKKLKRQKRKLSTSKSSRDDREKPPKSKKKKKEHSRSRRESFDKKVKKSKSHRDEYRTKKYHKAKKPKSSRH